MPAAAGFLVTMAPTWVTIRNGTAQAAPESSGLSRGS
jgi:hypothetical protein